MFLPKSIEKYDWRGQLVDVHKVTEWRKGHVYKTKRLGTIVMDSNHPATRDDVVTTSISTDTKFI